MTFDAERFAIDALGYRIFRQWRDEEGLNFYEIGRKVKASHVTARTIYSRERGLGDRTERSVASVLFGGDVMKLREEAKRLWRKHRGMWWTNLGEALKMRGETEWAESTWSYAAAIDARWKVDRPVEDWYRELSVHDEHSRSAASAGT